MEFKSTNSRYAIKWSTKLTGGSKQRTMQTEITQSSNLLLPSGKLVEVGWACQPDIIQQGTAHPG